MTSLQLLWQQLPRQQLPLAVVFVLVTVVTVSMATVTVLVFCMFTLMRVTRCQMFGAIAFSSATEINRQNNFRTFFKGLMLLFR